MKYFCHFGLTVDPAARYHGAGVVNVDDGEQRVGDLVRWQQEIESWVDGPLGDCWDDLG